MTPEQAAELRKPFPPSAIGKLPKPYSSQSQKAKCPECNGFHGMPAAHLDYVGHAATTDRLLSIDPEWSWEPFALDEHGLPAMQGKNLWIKLTICGVMRPGVGDGASLKECIGDAIRNAAMRFGVALDLWGKEELEQAHGPVRPLSLAPAAPAAVTAADFAKTDTEASAAEPMTAKTRGHMFALFNELGIDEAAQYAGIAHILGHPIDSRADLTETQGQQIVNRLKVKKAEKDAGADPVEPGLFEGQQ
jgi:hypothetical protein